MRILSSESKHPYGTFAFSKYVEGIFHEVQVNTKTINEISAEQDYEGVVIVANVFSPSILDLNEMLNDINEGKTYLLNATEFGSQFLDTLGLSLNYEFTGSSPDFIQQTFVYSVRDFFNTDTLSIQISNHNFEPRGQTVLRNNDQLTYFELENDSRFSVIATNSKGNPVAIRMKRGQGNLIVTTLPYAFTNIYLLHNQNELFVRQVLSYLPERVILTEFYEVGRRESKTLLRYILGSSPLRLALFTLLFTLIGFTILEIRRKQRAIPIVLPPTNYSLQFVKTIGNLYYEQKGNKTVAIKRIQFFKDIMRTQYFVDISITKDSLLVKQIQNKTGVDIVTIDALFVLIRKIEESTEIHTNTLVKFSKMLDEFYQKLG